MHQRLETSEAKATDLPIGEATFLKACDQLYQHRCIAHAIRRRGPTTFTSRVVTAWQSRLDWGPAVVYICKSDTQSPMKTNGLVLSVTHFPKKSILLAVAYGCTKESCEDIEDGLEYAKTFAFDPLILPMLWAQLERERLFNTVDRKAAHLYNRIIDMNNRLLQEGLNHRKSSRSTKSQTMAESVEMVAIVSDTTQTNITQRECAAVNLWVDVSMLKNGLEAFRTELQSMLRNSRSPLERDEAVFGPVRAKPDPIFTHSSNRIQHRLNEMIVEIEDKVRYTNSLLGGMTQATQTESNHLSRRDALTNIFIAIESKKDSSHMRYIAFLGMIFLPGTFFATLFSMTFFNWIPDNSDQVVSPWVAIYFGFTALSTAATVWRFHAWAKRRDAEAELSVTTQLEHYPRAGPLLPLSHGTQHSAEP
ncbi:hypothetical protein F4808DRAFT_453344 [Astrocystis sublimbata]|nr:hypothetical protein F4808DRAFT_453344 [Astrocystis sublimbata]